jgi:hypothetical protein
MCLLNQGSARFSEKKDLIDNSLRDVVPMWSGEHSGAAGTFQESIVDKKFIISVKKSKSENPISLIGTIAHELCHVMLLGENRISPNDLDMEPLTDLLTVYYGLGIFTGNSAIQTGRYFTSQGEGWHIERQGYLPQEYFGYSLALWAFLRNEHKPDWLKHCSVDIKEYCKKSLQLLHYEHKNNGIMPWKNNDTLTDEKLG